MKFVLVLLGVCAFYLVNATGDLEAELEASELQALEDTLDLIEKTPLEALEAEELEEERIKWGKLFSAAKKLYKKGKKLSKNKNFRKAVKFGMRMVKDMQNGEATEALEFMGETPLESLSAEELEEARIKWGKLFSAAKKLYKKGKKLSKNKNFRKAVKFGMRMVKDMQNGEATEALDFIGETPLESLSAEELEEERIKWKNLFSAAKKLYKKAKKLSKNKNFRKAVKFGMRMVKDMQNGEAREALDMDETSLESLSPEELEEERIKWKGILSGMKKIYKTAKKLSKNKNFKKAVKFGMRMVKDMQNGEAREALDFIDETPLESLSAEELEEARKINWGKIFSSVGKVVKKANKLSKNKNVKKAWKFGKQLASNLQTGEHEPGVPVGNNKCYAIGTTCTDDCDCCPEHHCHCPAKNWFPGLFRCTCQVTESDKVNKCPPAE